MRKEKDYRKDSIVKTEIYNEYIKDKYCVTAVLMIEIKWLMTVGVN